MKKLLLLFSAALTMLFVGCTQFDDTRIWDAIDELEDLFDDLDNRVEDLEEACEKMNTNIEALQTLVAALQANDTITAIAPIKQGDKIIGYTISFSKSEPITIYHGNDGKDGADGEDGKDGENGADGEDGYTPQIGIAKDSDNVYYWTLDGEWLLDENGNKIKAVGTDGKDGEDGEDGANGQDGADGEDGKDGEIGADGKDGITPQLEIRDGYWYISYDNGATWKELGKATGEDGKDGADGEDGKDGEDGTNGADGQDGKDGDSLFQSVTWDEEYAYFTLSDGTVIKIPLASDSEAEEGDLPPANEIWYTSTDGEVVTPFWEIDEEGNSVFNANIISNTYENGKGVITFDSDVTSIGYGAFAMRTNLKSIIIPNSVTVIGVSALVYNKTLTSVILPESLTFIGEEAFCGCSSLETITIPNSVVEIESYAFGECISLPIEDNVRYADTYAVEVIDDTLTTYSLKEGTRLVNEGLFRFCENLTSVILPESLTCIGKEMFSNCSNLENVVIPNSVTEIGGGAFAGCKSLAEFRGKFASSDGRCLIIDGVLNFFAPAGLTEYTIPEGVTIIEDDVFHGCSNLTNIAIPDSVTEIGNEAFRDCTSLTSVPIPDSVTSIGGAAFCGCSSLASITIPDGVTSIGYYAFADCKSLAEVYCKPTTPPTGGPDMFTYLDENWDIKPIGCMIYVPTESVGAYKAAEGWCDYADNIVGYDFENGGSGEDTTTPPANEIWYTSTDGEVVTPYATDVFGANIVSNTYENGKGVITFDGDVTTIGEAAFYYCTSLASVTIPDSVTTIGYYAFAECSSLTEFNGKFASSDGRCWIIDGVLNSFAPAGLTEYTIPNSVTSIGDYAFFDCTSLASVTIPDSVTSIGEAAFGQCDSLTSITIPDSITSIGDYAFAECKSLAEVYCKPTTPPTGGPDMFTYLDENWDIKPIGCMIYVPTESVGAYKAAEGWCDYAEDIEPYQF